MFSIEIVNKTNIFLVELMEFLAGSGFSLVSTSTFHEHVIR